MDVPKENNLKNGDKNYQAEEISIMQPVKPKKHVWLNKPAMLIQHKMQKKQIVPQEDNKHCQINRTQLKSKMCSNKNCQENENIDVWPVKMQMDVWSKKPTIKSSNKKLIGLAKEKKCQATACENNDSKSESFKCSDINCQEIIHMQSVTKKSDVCLPKPVIRRFCKDKTCQSTRCYKERNYDKNCQV